MLDLVFRRTLLACASISIAISLCGCATAYVDGALKDANLSEVRKPARPTDAQLLFTFQTKGTANARATETSSLTSRSWFKNTAGASTGNSKVVARFAVSRSGTVVYDKLITAQHDMYTRLIEQLFGDQEFKASLAAGEGN